MFAKILNAAVSKYPYDLSCLYAENPYTRFDISVDLPTLYSRTEDAANTGANIVGVVHGAYPAFNSSTEKVVADATPTLIDDIWVLGYSVVALTQAELDALAIANEVAQLGS